MQNLLLNPNYSITDREFHYHTQTFNFHFQSGLLSFCVHLLYRILPSAQICILKQLQL